MCVFVVDEQMINEVRGVEVWGEVAWRGPCSWSELRRGVASSELIIDFYIVRPFLPSFLPPILCPPSLFQT